MFCFILYSCLKFGIIFYPVLVKSSVSGIGNLSVARVKVKAVVGVRIQSGDTS